MTKDEALRLALEALEEPKEHIAKHRRLEAITAIKQVLAQEKALQALHNENERLGLYKDAYGQPEPEPVECKHRIADVTNEMIKSGYMCMDCGALFGAYTTPPKREPLTDEEIKDAVINHPVF